MKSVLDEAKALVHGNRGQDYGHPILDFTCAAEMFTSVAKRKGYLKEGKKFGPEDIPLFMQCVKVSRECNRHKRDNSRDGAGYWETNEMVWDAKLNGLPSDNVPKEVVADLRIDK